LGKTLNQMTNKKILNFIPNFSFGGVEITNLNLSKELSDLNYEVDFVTNNITNLQYEINQTVKIKSFNESKMRFCLIHLIKYIRRTKPDVIISSQFHANLIMILACIFSGYKNKIIICERVPVLENLKYISVFKRQLIKLMIKILYKFADHIIYNSYGTKNDLETLVKIENGTVIYNPVLNNDILIKSNSLVDDFEFNANTVYLIVVSRLSYEKNILELLDIISLIPSNYNFKLLIIGDGPLLNSAKAHSEYLGINDKVLFLGFKNNPYKYLKYSDIYLSTSKFEGMGNSIVEALHFGLDVISYKSPGGVNEILGDGKFGKIIQYGKKELFADYLINNFKKKNPNNSKELVSHLQKFDSNKVVDKFIKVIQKINNE
tara:strand:- start:1142 stop:2269 length:1128 start_codon:yes stop_codon:yes gene_type:complete